MIVRDKPAKANQTETQTAHWPSTNCIRAPKTNKCVLLPMKGFLVWVIQDHLHSFELLPFTLFRTPANQQEQCHIITVQRLQPYLVLSQ